MSSFGACRSTRARPVRRAGRRQRQMPRGRAGHGLRVHRARTCWTAAPATASRWRWTCTTSTSTWRRPASGASRRRRMWSPRSPRRSRSSRRKAASRRGWRATRDNCHALVDGMARAGLRAVPRPGDPGADHRHLPRAGRPRTTTSRPSTTRREKRGFILYPGKLTRSRPSASAASARSARRDEGRGHAVARRWREMGIARVANRRIAEACGATTNDHGTHPRASRARRRSQERRDQGQGRRQRHRRRPARQVPAQGQVRRRGRPTAASASATSCSAGTCSDVAYDNAQRHRLAARLSRRARAARPRHRIATCRGTTTCRSSSATSSTPTARAAPGLPAPDPEARAAARREARLHGRCAGMEFEWFNFRETPQSWAAKKGVAPEPLTPGMFGYSLLRTNQNREFFNALMDEMRRFGMPIEGLHTETGPGVYEAAIAFREALEQADRAILFKTGAKEIGARFGIMPSFMAKWNAQLPGLQRPHPPEPVGRQEEPVPRREVAAQDEQAVRELPRRPGRLPDGVRADVLADDQQLQAAGRRLLGAGQADLGHRQPHRELPRDRRLAQVDAARDALPGRRHQSVSRDGGRASPPACTASRRA